MLSKIDVQLHFWPWSTGIREETVNLRTGSPSFPFWGSPVVSASIEASLFLPQRHERFVPFGPPFETLGGECRLYETPHGVMANQRSNSKEAGGKILVHTKGYRDTVDLLPQGAIPRADEETDLVSVVIAWSQFFDDLIEEATKTKRQNMLPWRKIEDIIFKIAEDVAEPRMALIVDIAEHMLGRISIVVNAARKILFRERRMLPAGRVAETDSACLRWFVRQSGETMAQKAAVNRQRLLGLARRETFDTLENKVLKDFLFRCAIDGRRYLNTEVRDDQQLQQSKRARMVWRYRHLCTGLHQTPHLEGVTKPPSVLRPNYVLQNDYRYKKIWKHYVRLLRREDEEDRLWDWQSRTWADVSRLLVNTALFKLSRKNADGANAGLRFEELLTSAINVRKEQQLGCRIRAGSDPGPFIVRRWGTERIQASVLEIVHPDQARGHSATRLLGRLGGHLYLVLTPLSGGQRSIVVIWAVHTAGAEVHPPWEDIGRSAGQALQNHKRILDDSRKIDLPILHGFVVTSDMESKSAELHPGKSGGLHLVQVATDQRCWKDALAGITVVIEDILEEIL
jgi:hypothetical protein